MSLACFASAACAAICQLDLLSGGTLALAAGAALLAGFLRGLISAEGETLAGRLAAAFFLAPVVSWVARLIARVCSPACMLLQIYVFRVAFNACSGYNFANV